MNVGGRENRTNNRRMLFCVGLYSTACHYMSPSFCPPHIFLFLSIVSFSSFSSSSYLRCRCHLSHYSFIYSFLRPFASLPFSPLLSTLATVCTTLFFLSERSESTEPTTTFGECISTSSSSSTSRPVNTLCSPVESSLFLSLSLRLPIQKVYSPFLLILSRISLTTVCLLPPFTYQ